MFFVTVDTHLIFYRLLGYIILHLDCVLICLILWKRQSIHRLVFTAYCFLLLF